MVRFSTQHVFDRVVELMEQFSQKGGDAGMRSPEKRLYTTLLLPMNAATGH
jgi:hypothetical protein